MFKALFATLSTKPAVMGAAALLLAGAGATAGAATAALYTDSAASSGNAFAAGTVALRLSDANETSLAAISSSAVGSNLAPGDATTGYIDVANTGSLALRYAVTTA